MGWSNGAAMAILYALNRPWIAAAAVYSSPDPFGAFNDPCPQTPVAAPPTRVKELQVFNPHLPLMHVRNDCDIGGICPNGGKLARELRSLGDVVADVILDSAGVPVTSCEATCGTDEMANGQVSSLGSLRGASHHLKWPSSWDEKMLAFLKDHPLR
jgi:pimeloyl-ACP methyl ester carboxylesterase